MKQRFLADINAPGRDIYSGHFPSLFENFFKKLKTGKNLKDDLIKVRKNSEKFLESGGENFAGWPEYIPLRRDRTKTSFRQL